MNTEGKAKETANARDGLDDYDCPGHCPAS